MILGIISWILTIGSIIGVILIAYKRIECFYFFIPTSIGWVIYYLYVGIYASAVLFLIYTITNFLGIYNWRKDEKNN